MGTPAASALSTVLGSEKQRLAALAAPADIYIINRENTAWLVQTLGRKWDFDMVVLDEASSFKNHAAQRFKALKAVRPRIHKLVELTGTPSPNGLLDLWAQVWLLDQGQRLAGTSPTTGSSTSGPPSTATSRKQRLRRPSIPPSGTSSSASKPPTT